MSDALVTSATKTLFDNGSSYGSKQVVSSAFVGDGYFQDDFSSSDMSTTANGFQWAGRKGQLGTTNFLTSVCKQQADDSWYAVYNNGDLTGGGATDGNILTKNPNPSYYDSISSGTMLRANFFTGVQDTGEQGIYHSGLDEIWMAYWVKIPDNWTTPTGSPPNNKWLQWWCGLNTQYDVATTTQFSMNTYDAGGGVEELHVNCKDGTDGVYNGNTIASNFYSTADAGKWMHIIYRFKCSSTGNAPDGACEVYQRWEDESTYTQIINQQNLKLAKTPNAAGLQAGYLFGYSNRTYPVDCEFIVDNFELSLTKPSVLI